MNVTNLFLGVLFSAIGTGFFVYGKKQQAPVPLWCGVALMVYPYFVSNTLLLVLIGMALVGAPWFARR